MPRISSKVVERQPVNSEQPEHLGRRLRLARELAGLTQVELANRIGLQQSALSRIENEADMRVSTLRLYVEGLKASLHISARLKQPRSTEVSTNGVCGEDKAQGGGQLTLPILDDGYFQARRDIVFSIKPYYSQKIESGEKTVELRRRFPADMPPGTIIMIYSTSPTRALTGIAKIENVIVNSPDKIWRDHGSDACIKKPDFDEYFSGLDCAYAIKLCGARPLRRSLDLAELRQRFNFEPPQSFFYATPQLRDALGYECAEISNRH